ncbi:RsfA family transcriptional regulator [Peribacillus deserti]|uniref:Prespore-specific transcriptional regulator RsfA n=1 Tax=Peribacillus deserti TaxID=673318 RepID=A0A2N5M7B0_9BACI|nr:RsfA family transcriptional regulator [Peribacillus deserti]PLT30249.1 Prespore-specific transcriptional regulator RsfA [Peribacillus deserti]
MKVRQDAWTEENDLLLAETVLRHVREGSTQLNAFEEIGDKLNRTSAACGFRWNAVVRHNYEKALQLAKKQRKQRNRILGKEQGGKKKLLYNPPAPTIDEITNPVPLEEVHTFHSQDFEMAEMVELETQPFTTAPVQEIPAYTAPAATYTAPAAVPSMRTEITMDMVITYLQSLTGSQLQNQVLKSENERLRLEIKDLKQQNIDLQKRINDLEQNSGMMQEDYETLMKIMNRARKHVLLDEDDRPATKFKMDRNGNLEKVAE